MKKIIPVFIGAVLYAKSYLVVIENPFPYDVPVITSLEDFSISFFSDDELSSIGESLSYQIIDEYSPENVYYIVKSRFSDKKPEGVDILFERNGEYIVKGTPLSLNTKDFFVKRLSNRRMVREKVKNQSGCRFINPIIEEIVSRVDNDSILNFVHTLQNFITRNSFTQGCINAVNWAKGYMENHGLDNVYLHSYQNSYAPNLIGIKLGQTDSYYVISAHIDATAGNPWWPENIAPGADDNGSGSAGVLEAVRVTEGYNFHYSIFFILFTGEEQGLVGSGAWCNQHSSDPILGDINLDMIGYVNFYPESLDLVSNYQSVWLMDSFVIYTQNYVPQLKTRTIVNPNFWYSDHSSFWDIGKPAILGIEDIGVPNPYYHTRGDTIGAGFNSLTFCSDVIRSAVATISGLAKPLVYVRESETKSFYSSFVLKGGILYFKGKRTGFIYDASGKRIEEFRMKESVEFGKFKKGLYFIKTEKGNYRILLF